MSKLTPDEAKKMIGEQLLKSVKSIDMPVIIERLQELKDSPSTTLKLQQQIIALSYVAYFAHISGVMEKELCDDIGGDMRVAETHIVALRLSLDGGIGKALGLK